MWRGIGKSDRSASWSVSPDPVSISVGRWWSDGGVAIMQVVNPVDEFQVREGLPMSMVP